MTRAELEKLVPELSGWIEHVGTTFWEHLEGREIVQPIWHAFWPDKPSTILVMPDFVALGVEDPRRIKELIALAVREFCRTAHPIALLMVTESYRTVLDREGGVKLFRQEVLMARVLTGMGEIWHIWPILPGRKLGPVEVKEGLGETAGTFTGLISAALNN